MGSMNPHARTASVLTTIGLVMAGLAMQAGDPFALFEALVIVTAAERILALQS